MGRVSRLVAAAALFILALNIQQTSSTELNEPVNNSIQYAIDSGVRRNTLVESDGLALTYNVRAGMYPHVSDEGDGRLDLMLVNKPPTIVDSYGIFNYSRIKGEVAWAALTLNLSAVNATVIFEPTVDFTNTANLNLDRDVNLTFNYIELNVTTMTAVNKTGKMTLRNLSFQSVKILKDDVDCDDCTVLSYEGGVAVFKTDPTLTSYRAVELAGWVTWNVIDLTSNWVGSIDNNKGVIIIGEEGQDNTLRQYYSSNATDSSLTPKLEINYTIRQQHMYSNQTLSDAFDLDDYFWDLDADTLTFQTSPDHPNVLLTIDDTDHTVDIQPINNWYGIEYAVFTGSDGRGGWTVSNNVTLNVSTGVTTTTSTSTTLNKPPVVHTIYGDTGIVLNPGSWKNVTYNATVSDDDGCLDINLVKAVLWDNHSATHDSGPNDNSVYINDSCSFSCPSGNAECSFNLAYYANASDEWAINMSAWDEDLWGHNVTYPLTVNSLLAINITNPSLIFKTDEGGSTFTFGETSREDNITVQNIGNVVQDMLTNGTDLPCTIGDPIGVGQVKYHNTTLTVYDSMFALTYDQDETDDILKEYFDLGKTLDGTSSEKPIYWRIKIPVSGVGGTCNGTLSLMAEEE
ncbi:MAG: hypothetical protein V1744_06815 [Candidatus Altiarchaeota archaeon]